MPKSIRVDPIDLLVSSDTVDTHAEELRLAHSAAQLQIESAFSGLPGASLAAMTAKAAQWHESTEALLVRLLDHAEALRAGAMAYQLTDNNGAQSIDEVAAAMGRSLGTD